MEWDYSLLDRLWIREYVRDVARAWFTLLNFQIDPQVQRNEIRMQLCSQKYSSFDWAFELCKVLEWTMCVTAVLAKLMWNAHNVFLLNINNVCVVLSERTAYL